MYDISSLIKAEAARLGFSFINFTNASQSPHYPQYIEWLSSGYSGELSYLTSEKTVKSRENPETLLDNATSIIVVGLPYKPLTAQLPNTSTDNSPQGLIASYAAHEDYHSVLKNRIRQFINTIRASSGLDFKSRIFVDSAPLMEKDSAYMAGAGWIGRNSLLITPDNGSFQVIGCILTDLNLPTQEPFTQDLCGNCRRCIQACPTGCITPNHSIDAGKCIAYLTIEYKGVIPRDLRSRMGKWVFGCDICQNICPINKKLLKNRPAFNDALSLRVAPAVDLLKEIELTSEEFEEKYRNTSVLRATYEGFKRNLIIAMGNSGSYACVQPLTKIILQESSWLLRLHAVWALGQIESPEIRQIMQKCLDVEKDERVLDEISLTI